LGAKPLNKERHFLRIKQGKKPLDDSAAKHCLKVILLVQKNASKIRAFPHQKLLETGSPKKIDLKHYCTEMGWDYPLTGYCKELEKNRDWTYAKKQKVFTFKPNMKNHAS